MPIILYSPGPLQELDELVLQYRQNSYAQSTKKSYSSHLKAYNQFCNKYNISPLPLSSTNVSRYAAYLAGIKQLKPSSVPKYLNIIRILHKEAGFPNPLEENWFLQHVIRGIKRTHGDEVRQVHPVTPQMLLQIQSKLDLTTPLHKTFWAASLAMFFGLLRKSNVLGQSQFDATKHLTRKDILSFPDHLALNIRWTKTVQNKERNLMVPLPCIPQHPLCPATAVSNMVRSTLQAPLDGPAFCYTTADGVKPLTYSQFLNIFKIVMNKLDYQPNDFACHSFRRGGATWALSVGIPGEMIQILGDWRVKAMHAHTLLSSIG